MSERRYVDHALEVRLSVNATSARLRLEHKSGAALIVPDAPLCPTEGGARLTVSTFDGVQLILEAHHDALRISASGPTALLGDRTECTLPRGPDRTDTGPTRVTGDESTMPIPLDDG